MLKIKKATLTFLACLEGLLGYTDHTLKSMGCLISSVLPSNTLISQE